MGLSYIVHIVYALLIEMSGDLFLTPALKSELPEMFGNLQGRDLLILDDQYALVSHRLSRRQY